MPRGKAQKSLDLIDHCADILQEIHPATIRAVCYRLFVAKVIASMAPKDIRPVYEQLKYAREEGIIPWEWIVDETRLPKRAAVWDDPEAYLEVVRSFYRKDTWLTQPVRIECWSEKATVQGMLMPVLNQYAVTFRVLHGFGSCTALHDAAEESADDPRPFVVLYVGDWDPSGLWMSNEDIPARLQRYGGRAEVVRIALTADDVRSGDLPSFDVETKAKDSRTPWFIRNYGTRCWELDALSPNVLRDRLRWAIEGWIDWGEWERVQLVQQAERDSLYEFVGHWKAAR